MSHRWDLRRPDRFVFASPARASRRANFAIAQRTRTSRVEQLEPRLTFAADLEELLTGDPGKTPLPQPADWLDTAELSPNNQGGVTRTIVPGEIILGMAGDVTRESVQVSLQNSLQLTQLDTGGSIRLDPLLSATPGVEAPVTVFRLHLGNFQNVRGAGRIIEQQIPGVAWAAPNYEYRGPLLEFTPNDPDFLDVNRGVAQYGLLLTETDLAWDVTLGSPSVIIAVTDNGMQMDHPDLAPNLWVNSDEIAGNGIDDDNNGFIDDRNGWDFVTGDNNPSPANATNDVHGTAVAGVIGARINNGIGGTGAAGMSTLMPLRVLGSDGGLTSAGLLSSFAYAANNGAKIVNTSLDLDAFVNDTTINTALQFLYDNNVLSISSAGNAQQLNPARQKFHQTLLVAGTTYDQIKFQEVPAAYTNYGTGIDIGAPGDFIWTTITGGTNDLIDLHVPYQGSSIAAGFISGIAALIWSANPTYTRDQVAARLIGTADSLDAANPDFAGLLGSGRANANVGVNSTLIPLPAPKLKGIREVTPGQAILPISQMNVGLASVFSKTTIETDANWSLVGAGPDNTLGNGDDVPVTLTRVNPYMIGANDVTFSFPTLAPGNYRFTALSGGLRDPFNTALDGDGNGAAGGNFVQDFTVSAGTTVFSADFSDVGGAPSPDGFGLAGSANAWHLTNGRGNDPGHSTDDSAYFGAGETLAGGGLYAINADGSLVSPVIDLSRYTGQISLDFNEFLQSEVGFDFANVRVLEGTGGTTIATTNTTIGVDTVLAPTTTGWQHVTLDLSNYAGHAIRLQFQFTSDDSNNLEGWYLDDITVRAATALPSANLSGQVWNDVNGNRVRDAGDNGAAGWTVYLDANNNGTFDTATQTNVASTDVPQVIPDGTFIDSVTTVSGLAGTIADLDVTVNITHSYVSDLDLFLVSPGGVRIRLAGEEGAADADNYTNTRFDDEAAVSIVGAAAPFTGSFRPEGSPLSVYDGINPNGTWHLEIGDYYLVDTGLLNSWTLHFTIAEPARVTDATGNYAFNNLVPGNYIVREVPQATWNQAVPLTGFYNVNPTNGQSLSTLDFANSQAPLAPPTFQVTAATPTRTGVVIDFNHDLNTSSLNLYQVASAAIGASDFVLLPSAAGSLPVRGSIVVDPNLRRLTFVATTGLLPADTYTLTLVSATDGFKDSTDALLDGDANGTPGGNYTAPVTITAPAANAVSISIPNFARGPQQPVNLPTTTTTGIPISFSDGNLITSANFQITYDPAVLTITGATVAPGLTGATVSTGGSIPGTLQVQFSSPTPLAAGTTRFIDIQANVPTSATYRSKSLLDISNIVLNGGAIPGLDDDSVMVSAFFGDVSGNGSYASTDVTRTQYISTGLDRGYQVYKLLDPWIIGDVTGTGGISSQDVTRLIQASVGTTVPGILTPLPAGFTLTPGGPDPRISVPQSLAAAPGSDVKIPVMIDSIVDLTGNGLEGADLVIYFDPTVLTVNDVHAGSLMADKGWFANARIDNLTGQMIVSLATSARLEGKFAGELLAIDATVKADAPSGASAINLAASARGLNLFTALNEGNLTLIPAPTDAANDAVDGVLTVVAPPAASSDQPSARVVDGGLLILGTTGADRVLVAPLGNNQVRVRAGNQILGTFAAPSSIALDLLGGQDYAYVAPSVAPAVVATSVDSATDDAIFGGRNSLVVDDQDSWAAVLNDFRHGASAADQRAARDLALLELATQWSTQPASSTSRGVSRLLG